MYLKSKVSNRRLSFRLGPQPAPSLQHSSTKRSLVGISVESRKLLCLGTQLKIFRKFDRIRQIVNYLCNSGQVIVGFGCTTGPNLEKKRKETDTAKNNKTLVRKSNPRRAFWSFFFFLLLCTLLHCTANGANEESSIDRKHSLKMTMKSEPQGEYLFHFLFLCVCLCLCLCLFFFCNCIE